MDGALFRRCAPGECVTVVGVVRTVGSGGGSATSDDGLSSGSDKDLCLRRGRR